MRYGIFISCIKIYKYKQRSLVISLCGAGSFGQKKISGKRDVIGNKSGECHFKKVFGTIPGFLLKAATISQSVCFYLESEVGGDCLIKIPDLEMIFPNVLKMHKDIFFSPGT